MKHPVSLEELLDLMGSKTPRLHPHSLRRGSRFDEIEANWNKEPDFLEVLALDVDYLSTEFEFEHFSGASSTDSFWAAGRYPGSRWEMEASREFDRRLERRVKRFLGGDERAMNMFRRASRHILHGVRGWTELRLYHFGQMQRVESYTWADIWREWTSFKATWGTKDETHYEAQKAVLDSYYEQYARRHLGYANMLES